MKLASSGSACDYSTHTLIDRRQGSVPVAFISIFSQISKSRSRSYLPSASVFFASELGFEKKHSTAFFIMGNICSKDCMSLVGLDQHGEGYKKVDDEAIVAHSIDVPALHGQTLRGNMGGSDPVKVGNNYERADSNPSSDFARRYSIKLQEQIGSGSTSKVYNCIRRSDKKEFACKVINKAEVETSFSGLMEQFNLEIKVLKTLNNPHIIKLEDAFETSDCVYMVLEKCRGGELFDYVVDKGTLSEEEASKIIRNLTSAVQHMHSLNVIHRDLKPENLLLTSNGKDAEIKLIDFGLAKVMQDDVARSFLGTKGYLAPEMLKRDAYDKSVDIWALGVICFVLLCGCLPFDDDGSRIASESAARKKFTLRFPRWSMNLSSSAKDLLYNLLDVDPKTRYTSQQALSHPWVMGTTVQPNNYLQSPSQLKNNRVDVRTQDREALQAEAAGASQSKSKNGKAGGLDGIAEDYQDGAAGAGRGRKHSF